MPEVSVGRPQVSFVKRQREQAKKEKAQAKAARRAERKTEKQGGGPPIEADEFPEQEA